MRRLSTMGATLATVVATAVDTAVAIVTVADIRHHAFRYQWATEITVVFPPRIMETQFSILVTVATLDMVAIMGTAVIAHGTTQPIWTTTRLHWFLTVVTSTMFPATTTCITRGTGILTAIDF